MSSRIVCSHVKKVYAGGNVVIPDLSVEIQDGEFFTLLGPSGCGKTTLLRMLAGFNTVEGGQICFNDRVMNDVPAYKRNIGMVFQNYAVFPHMTVRENIEYGLKLREPDKAKRRQQCNEIMEVVKITEHADKHPDQLSGGQQQRVALARAIVIKPDVLLMDEPLSNLDAKLRIEMRTVIKDIQKKVGITTVYVTHDQEEALAVSDRIAVMDKGVIQQINAPKKIYLRPYCTNVASFIGRSNIFDAFLNVSDGRAVVTTNDGYTFQTSMLADGVGSQAIKLAVRPEEFVISRTGSGIKVKVLSSTFLGKYNNYIMQTSDGRQLEVSTDSGIADEFYSVGEEVSMSVLESKVNLFTADGTKSLIRGVSQYAE
ncbi:MAG: ABC transporter ATP-binding protein [Clostridiales bacterium]|nr:ABC transporter ATP-binding protein [Clostridiales bacterium]MDY2835525.1 ABC transporter ATP-binding protein [Candidatus Aphodomonas sp.]